MQTMINREGIQLLRGKAAVMETIGMPIGLDHKSKHHWIKEKVKKTEETADLLINNKF